MRIIGQEHLRKEIELLAIDIARGNHHNIIIEGKSGCGKSTVARYIADRSYQPYQIILGNENILTTGVLIVDEAHRMSAPETLYRIMDNHFMTVIILTTEIGELPEPLVNRCIPLKLKDYTEKELYLIAEELARGNFPPDFLKEVVNRCRSVPRNIELMIEMMMIHKRNSEKIVIKQLLDNFGIYEDGFTDLDYNYLNFLKENGTASLLTLSKFLGIPKSTLENYIEPFLLRKRLIQITTSGRKLIK